MIVRYSVIFRCSASSLIAELQDLGSCIGPVTFVSVLKIFTTGVIMCPIRLRCLRTSLAKLCTGTLPWCGTPIRRIGVPISSRRLLYSYVIRDRSTSLIFHCKQPLKRSNFRMLRHVHLRQCWQIKIRVLVSHQFK